MSASSDPKPDRRRRGSRTPPAGPSPADAPDYRQCAWQPGVGWQPLPPEAPPTAGMPTAWCTLVPGEGWTPIRPPGSGAGRSPAPEPGGPQAGTSLAPATPLPEPIGAVPPPAGVAAAAAQANLPAPAPPSPVAAAATGLPPEVAAFYTLLFSPLPSAPGPQAAAGLGLAPGPDAANGSLWDSFRTFTARLGDALNQFVANVSSLQVDTYTSTNPSSVHLDPDPQRSSGENLALLARTLVAFDGDTQLSLPAQRGVVDPVLMQLHLQLVHEAQYNRAQFLQMMADLGSQLLGVFKPR